MTLRELEKNVAFMVSQLRDYEDKNDKNVVIHIKEPSIGAMATVGISSIYLGFDWDTGKVIIETDTPLVRKGHS